MGKRQFKRKSFYERQNRYSFQWFLFLCSVAITFHFESSGYVIGATNVLFKQKRGIADVIIDVEKDRIDIFDPELKRALQLTTEDLRFVDNLIRHVTMSPSSSVTSSTSGGENDLSTKKHDVFLDSTLWEGGDEWIRAQFRFYLLCKSRVLSLKSSVPQPFFR